MLGTNQSQFEIKLYQIKHALLNWLCKREYLTTEKNLIWLILFKSTAFPKFAQMFSNTKKRHKNNGCAQWGDKCL